MFLVDDLVNFLVASEQEMRRAVELTLLCGLGLTALVDPAAGFVPGGQCATKRAGYDSGDWLRQRTTTSAPPRRISSSSSSSLETSTTSDEYEVSCLVGCKISFVLSCCVCAVVERQNEREFSTAGQNINESQFFSSFLTAW